MDVDGRDAVGNLVIMPDICYLCVIICLYAMSFEMGVSAVVVTGCNVAAMFLYSFQQIFKISPNVKVLVVIVVVVVVVVVVIVVVVVVCVCECVYYFLSHMSHLGENNKFQSFHLYIFTFAIE